MRMQGSRLRIRQTQPQKQATTKRQQNQNKRLPFEMRSWEYSSRFLGPIDIHRPSFRFRQVAKLGSIFRPFFAEFRGKVGILGPIASIESRIPFDSLFLFCQFRGELVALRKKFVYVGTVPDVPCGDERIAAMLAFFIERMSDPIIPAMNKAGISGFDDQNQKFMRNHYFLFKRF
nr:MAG TPA: hypothetical protein [Caudoviricetes sp.]